MGFRLAFRKKTSQINIARIFLVLLLLIQFVFVLTSQQGLGKEDEDIYLFTPNNPIPGYALDHIKVENDILFSCPISNIEDSIEIYNVSDHLNFQHYATYSLNSSLAEDGSNIIKYQIFDDKLFIVIQLINYSSILEQYRTAIEIVDISDVQNPVYISHMVFNGTYMAEHPIVDIYSYRMFFSDDLLYITTFDYSYIYSRWSVRVLNCTDIHHPKEIARTNFDLESVSLLDYYLIDDILYTFTIEDEVDKLTIFNYTDISNITIISKSDVQLDYQSNFIGHYNDYLFIDATSDEQYSYQIYENYTLGFLDNWTVPDDYKFSCIKGHNMFRITSDTFNIYNIMYIGSLQQIGSFIRDPNDDVATFRRFDLDKTRAYIACSSDEEGAILYVIDFSDLTNLVQLLLDYTAISSIPLLSIVFALSIISILNMLKKRKIKKKK